MSDSDAPPPSTSPAADAADADAAAAPPLAAAPLPLAADGKVKAKELKRLQKAYKRRGVVYMSRVPPNMRPQKVRHLLSAHADIGRVYLAPEDAGARAARRKGAKGAAAAAAARSKRYVEGWIEFEDKAVAKQVAATLNATPIGGKRRSAHAADLWTLKYLPGFKWDDLTADVAAAAHARDARRAAEAAAAAADRDFYLAKVDAARAAERADARRAAKRAAEGGEGDDAPPAAARPAKRQYGQRPAAPGADARALPRGALAALAGL